MSDYLKTRRKVQEGLDWRGEVSVSLDGDEHTLKIRQPTDPEYFDVIEDIDREGLKRFEREAPTEELDRFRELREKRDSDDDSLSDEEQGELEELEATLVDEEGVLDYVDEDTFNAIRRLAKYCVVPDSEDVQEIASTPVPELREMYGDDVVDEYTDPNGSFGKEQARVLIKEDLEEMVDNMTGFSSFELGLEALDKALSVAEDDEGN